MIPVILARSPHIIEMNENNANSYLVELRIWNGTGSAPTNPTYTLSKPILSTSNRRVAFNISPYVKEFLSHPLFTNNHNSIAFLPSEEYCNVQIKKYKVILDSYTQIGETELYYGIDGYGLYNEGAIVNTGREVLSALTADNDYYEYLEGSGLNILDLAKNHYYYYVQGSNLNNEPLKRPGNITVSGGDEIEVIYDEIGSTRSTVIQLPLERLYIVPRVFIDYIAKGCLTTVFRAGYLPYSYVFRPKTECKYTPICCDFINRYGAWQREYFFKASKNSINVENSEYNLYQAFVNYDTKEGQRKTFNTNYSETITVNTDWVSEDFSENLRELMTSERILLYNRPVKLNTKSVELQKHINTKMINYTLEFQYAFDIINNVI